MRAIRTTQKSIFETDPVDHVIAQELAGISVWLDRHRRLLDQVAKDIDPDAGICEARSGLSVESLLRCAILKQYRQVSYRELVFLLKDSRSFQHFARLDPFSVPKKSTLQSLISRIRPETWEALNLALLKTAKSKRVETGQRIRIDATVTQTHILSPTDSRLLLDGVRVMVNLLKQAQAEFEPVTYTNHLRVAKRRHRAISSARSAERRAELYGDLLQVVAKTLGYLADAYETMAQSPDGAAWQTKVEGHRTLIEQVIEQTKRRVFDGETVPAGDKVVSLFESHTDIIQKGGREIQYGHKINLCTGTSGLVLDVVIEDGNPADTQCLRPMLERHIEHYRHAPTDLATDGGYASRDNLDQAKALGIKNVAFHKKKGLEIEAMTKARWLYYKLKRFRAGIEAGISYLKRCFGLSRCHWKGLTHFKSYIWSSIFTHNLVVFARLQPAPN